MAQNVQYRGQLLKGEVLASEMESFITKKQEALVIKRPDGTKVHMSELENAQEATQDCVRYIPLITNSGDLDQRKTDANILVDRVMRTGHPANCSSPSKVNEETDTCQAIGRPLKQWKLDRKKMQQDLLDIMLERHRRSWNYTTDKNGRSKTKDGQQLSTEEFCNALDKLTINELEMMLADNNLAADEGQSLRELAEQVIGVVVLRWVEDSCNQNDLALEGGYQIWKQHAFVMTSFATFYTALYMRYKALPEKKPLPRFS